MKTLDQARLGTRHRRALREAVRILKERFPVERVVLFGSQARGDAGADSDIDLLVLTRRALDWRERGQLVDALFEVQLAHDVVLSPLVLAAKDWDSRLYAAIPIRAEVDRDGIAL